MANIKPKTAEFKNVSKCSSDNTVCVKSPNAFQYLHAVSKQDRIIGIL